MLKSLMYGYHFCFAPDGGDPAGGGGNPNPAPNPAPGPNPTNPDPKPGPDPQNPANPAPDPKPGDPAPEQPTGVFSEKWREDMAGTDEKDLQTLQRMAGPKDLWNAYKALRGKMSSGELKAPLPKDATPEQVAEFRKENGIPEKAEEYLKALPEGLVFGDKDKAVLDPFLKDMHDMNAPPAVVAKALEAYRGSLEQQQARMQEADVDFQINTEDTLRAEWGAKDYRINMNAIQGFLKANFPEAAQNALMNARDDKGRPLMSNPEFLRGLIAPARALNPVGTTHGSGPDSLDTIESRITELKKVMGTKAWYADDAKQAEYRQLVSSRDRIKSAKR